MILRKWCQAYAMILLLSSGGVVAGSTRKSWAGNATSSLAVSATVPPVVNVDTGPVNNIPYDATDADAQGEINIIASSGSVLTIRMGEGTNPGDGSTPADPIRRMKSPAGNYLNYSLSQDASHTINWGNTTATGVTITGTGSQQTVNFYINIPQNQTVPAGDYTDTIQMTTDY